MSDDPQKPNGPPPLPPKRGGRVKEGVPETPALVESPSPAGSHAPTPPANAEPTLKAAAPAEPASPIPAEPTPVPSIRERNAKARERRKKKLDKLGPPPAQIGIYKISERLGVGGMAEVFLATDTTRPDSDQLLVVKRMLPHLAIDQNYTQMFLREVQVAAGLDHPNIVKICGADCEQDLPYMVLDFVDGLTLRELAVRSWKASRSVPMEVVLQTIADAAVGLHFAYNAPDKDGLPRRVVHRDVSADNIMVDVNGVTKLLDFGIAKAADSSNLTRTGQLKGKIPFMAPEYVTEHIFDCRSDLYSLGVVLYWLLTGKRPFAGATEVHTIKAILTETPPRPGSKNPTVPSWLDDLVMSLIAKKPGDRPSSGEEVAKLLGEHMRDARDLCGHTVRQVMNLHEPIDDNENPSSGSGSRQYPSIQGLLAATPVSSNIFQITPAAGKISGKSSESTADDDLQIDLATAFKQMDSEISQASEGLVKESAATEDPFDAIGQVTQSSTLLLRSRQRKKSVVAGLAAAALTALLLVLWASGSDAEKNSPSPRTVDAGNHTLANNNPRPPATKAATPDQRPAPQKKNSSVRARHRKGKRTPRWGTKKRTVKENKADPTHNEAPPLTAVLVAAPQAPAMQSVKLIGPGRISWSRAGGEYLAKGRAVVKMAQGDSVLKAYDPVRKVSSRVPINSGTANYTKIKRGKIKVLCMPFAEEVLLGDEKLGSTPLPAISAVPGTYKITLKNKGKIITKTVVVKAGQEVKVKVRF